MDWSGLADPVALPRLAATGILLGVAACLVLLQGRNRARVGFAAFCAAFAAAVFFNTMGARATDPNGSAGWFPFTKYAGIVEIAALAQFASSYPRRRGWLGRGRAPLALLWGAAILCELLVWQDPALWFASPDGRSGLSVGHWGPIGVFLADDNLAMGVVAVLLALDYRRMDAGPRRHGVLLVWLGLAVNVLYDSATAAAWTARGYMGAVPLDSNLWNQVQYLLSFVGLAVGYIAFGIMMAGLARDPQARRGDRLLLGIALPIPIIAALAETIIAPDVELFDSPFKLVINGCLRIALGVLPTYALLRYQLLDLDVRIKATLRHTLALAMLTGLFFLLSNTLQAALDSSSLATNLLVAAAIAVALWPAEWLAKRFMNRILPEGTPDALRLRKLEVYRVAVEAALEDGEVTPRERRVLETLAQHLELDEYEARSIEQAAAARAAAPTAGSRDVAA